MGQRPDFRLQSCSTDSDALKTLMDVTHSITSIYTPSRELLTECPSLISDLECVCVCVYSFGEPSLTNLLKSFIRALYFPPNYFRPRSKHGALSTFAERNSARPHRSSGSYVTPHHFNHHSHNRPLQSLIPSFRNESKDTFSLCSAAFLCRM